MKFSYSLITIFALIIGGLVGTSVGVLIAPRSGRATRAMLRSKGVQLQEKVTEDISMAGGQVKDRIGGLTSDARHKVLEISDQVKETVGSISLPFPANGH